MSKRDEDSEVEERGKGDNKSRKSVRSLGSGRRRETSSAKHSWTGRHFMYLIYILRDRYGYAGRRSNAVGDRGQFLVARHAFTHAGGAGGKDTGARVGGW